MIPKSSCSDNHIGEDDVVKLCPVCKAVVRFFFINFTEKVLMCENEFCEFPLGYEDLQFIEVDSGVNFGKDASSSSRHNTSGSSSVTSYVGFSDNDKLNKVCESTENLLDLYIKPTNSKRKKIRDKHIANNKEIKNSVQDLKNHTTELNEMHQVTDEGDFIKNEKWLEKLMKLQVLSGVKLVKKEEMKLHKQKTPVFGSSEIKIDIDYNRNNSSSIIIQIMNTDGDRTTSEDVT